MGYAVHNPAVALRIINLYLVVTLQIPERTMSRIVNSGVVSNCLFAFIRDSLFEIKQEIEQNLIKQRLQDKRNKERTNEELKKR